MKDDDAKQKYYEKMAPEFDTICIHEDDEHDRALKYISSFIQPLNIKSILDVGCGTGRGIGYFRDNFPDRECHGIDLSKAQLSQAVAKRNIPENKLLVGSATELPFEDNSFDIVCEFGILHHIREPERAVKEMLRVAQKAVFISDCNRFAQGSILARWLKIFLWKCNLWNTYIFLSTKGKGYHFSEEDGLAYSYSIFDNINFIREKAIVHLFPTSQPTGSSLMYPILTNHQILICAIKEYYFDES